MHKQALMISNLVYHQTIVTVYKGLNSSVEEHTYTIN